jgi:hypothetical protein
MHWLKEVFVDIIVTLFIISSIFIETSWMQWVIIGYTALMLLVKIIVLVGDSSLQLIRKTATDAPDWIPHLLYALNTGFLFYGQWWATAIAWGLIWILSFIAQRKLNAMRGHA